MQVEEGVGEPGHVRDDRLQVLAVGRDAAEDGVGERLAQAADDLVVVLLGEGTDVDRERLGQSHHDLGGQRALIVLDLVQVARRDAEALGERALVQAAGFPQQPDLGTDEDLLAHLHL